MMVMTKAWKMLGGERGWDDFLSGERIIGVHPANVQKLSSHNTEIIVTLLDSHIVF